MKLNRIINISVIIMIAMLSLYIVCCGQKGERPDTTTSTDTSTDPTAELDTSPQTVFVSLSQPTVKTDGTDSTIITVEVLDESRVGISGLTVLFAAEGGKLSTSSDVTDEEDAKAECTFSAGPDKENKVVSVTVTVADLDPVIVPIQIVDTSITLGQTTANLQVGGDDTDTLQITLKDANDVGISDQDITVKIDASSTGKASLVCISGDADCSVSGDVATIETDFNGQGEVDVTGTVMGDVTVTAEALGAKSSISYTIGVKGTSFGITTPATDPYSLATGSDLTVIIDAPGVTSVKFATTLGTWDGGAERVVTKTVSGGTASAVLNSTLAGVATVQVFDANDASVKDSTHISVSAPTSEAIQVDIQASPSIVAKKSSDDLVEKAYITAFVKNSSDQPVGGASVAFSIVNPIGGGEYVFPVLAVTDSYGVAESTFWPGYLASDSFGIYVQADVLDGAVTPNSTPIIIGGTAGSIFISHGTTIRSEDNDTNYVLPMSVLVIDPNGNPVKGTKVSLSLWPAKYRIGIWYEVEPGKCEPRSVTRELDPTDPDDDDSPYDDAERPNEDVDRNLILDLGSGAPGDLGEDINQDGLLTPPNSAAGELPATVTTDDSGIATFDLKYGKAAGYWLIVEVTATTIVLGDQNQSTYTFDLPIQDGEQCALPDSPYLDAYYEKYDDATINY